MATASLTTTPTVIDPGTAASVAVTNTGDSRVTITTGHHRTLIRSGRDANIIPAGPVTAHVTVADGSTGSIGYGATYDSPGSARAATAIQVAGAVARGTVSVRLGQRASAGTPAAMGTAPTLTVTGPGGSSPTNAETYAPGIAYDDARVRHLGTLRELVSQLGSDYWQNAVNGEWTPGQCGIEIDHYGDDLSQAFRAAYTSVQLWVWVDEGTGWAPATAAPVSYTGETISAGSLSWLQVEFASVAHRRIRIYRYLADFGGLDIPPTHQISPTAAVEPTLLVYGDSIAEGWKAAPELGGFAVRLGLMLGMETYVAGQGGTGYVMDPGVAGKGPYTSPARLEKVGQVRPDWMIIFGSSNDDNLTGVQAAAASVYSEVARLSPETRIIVVGPPSMVTPVSTARTASSAAVAAAAAAAGNVAGFINPLSDTQGLCWFTGTGSDAAAASDGSADVFHAGGDGLGHPNLAGHEYLAYRIAQAAAGIMSTVA